jgi:hypothetical protein
LAGKTFGNSLEFDHASAIGERAESLARMRRELRADIPSRRRERIPCICNSYASVPSAVWISYAFARHAFTPGMTGLGFGKCLVRQTGKAMDEKMTKAAKSLGLVLLVFLALISLTGFVWFLWTL